MENRDYSASRAAALSGKALVNSDALPKDADWETLKAWGIHIAGEAQELFYDVILPDGWRKVVSANDSRHSSLMDDRGRERASIFYKSAYYDRCAIMTVHKERYYVRDVYDATHGGLQYAVIDRGDNKAVKQFEPSYYAVLHNLGVVDKLKGVSPVGLLCGDTFFYAAIDAHEKPRFRKTAAKESCYVISEDAMFTNFHHVKPIHAEIRAATAKAQESALVFLSSLPQGLAAWGDRASADE